MKTQTAYCSACDTDVQIVITDEPSADGQANLHDAEIVCLEIGDNCTGSMCPIGAAPASVMAARLVRNGLQTVMQPVVQARCSGCGQVTSHVIAERSHATCTVCGATTARSGLVLVSGPI
jgi:hypothetical protein